MTSQTTRKMALLLKRREFRRRRLLMTMVYEKDIKESHPNDDDTKTQEAIDSDDEAIWIKKCPREQNSLTKHKCFNCSRIFPSAETLNTHKCRKRTRKRKPTDDNSVCVPTQEDFLKKVKKTKSRENASQIVTCHNCNESFSSKVRLKFHIGILV
ncbi:unnamed protein product [Leptidea sinapis]|uniref:Uncharacterized protein n=1 Tax=Leptidea sinapis TaxID=189913 RepID=A0A5E4Q9T7_9NEOP|nr:unnamed protein product [Leptidea sinapis]